MTALRRGSGGARAARRPQRELRLGLAVIAFTALAGWISTVAIDGVPWASPYQLRLALPPGAPLLHAGDEVREAGERAGQVSSIALSDGAGARAIATLSLSGGAVGRGVSARIRPRGLAGAVYVDLAGGDPRRPLASGSVIPAAGSVQLTDVIGGFDGAAQRAMRAVAAGYGAGLAGGGVTINHVLSSAPRLLDDLTPVMRALRPTPGALAGTVGDARAVAGALAAPGLLGELVGLAHRVLGETAAHAGDLAQGIAALPAVETATAQVAPGAVALLARASSAAGALVPAAAALSASLPQLARVERLAPAITQYSQVAGSAVPVLNELTPVLARAAAPVTGIAPLSSSISEIAGVLTPYRDELIEAPLGFTRWGDNTYAFGTGSGHRAVRFSMVLTCALARDPYPAPGAAAREHAPCP